MYRVFVLVHVLSQNWSGEMSTLEAKMAALTGGQMADVRKLHAPEGRGGSSTNRSTENDPKTMKKVSLG